MDYEWCITSVAVVLLCNRNYCACCVLHGYIVTCTPLQMNYFDTCGLSSISICWDGSTENDNKKQEQSKWKGVSTLVVQKESDYNYLAKKKKKEVTILWWVQRETALKSSLNPSVRKCGVTEVECAVLWKNCKQCFFCSVCSIFSLAIQVPPRPGPKEAGSATGEGQRKKAQEKVQHPHRGGEMPAVCAHRRQQGKN